MSKPMFKKNNTTQKKTKIKTVDEQQDKEIKQLKRKVKNYGRNEVKYNFYGQDLKQPTSASFYDLTEQIGVGDTNLTRTGSVITLKKASIRVLWKLEPTQSAFPVTVRMILILGRGSSDPQSSDILQGYTGVLDEKVPIYQYNADKVNDKYNSKRPFTVLYDKVKTLNVPWITDVGAGVDSTIPHTWLVTINKYFAFGGMKVNYDSAGNDISNRLILALFPGNSTVGANNAIFSFQSKLYFSDV